MTEAQWTGSGDGRRREKEGGAGEAGPAGLAGGVTSQAREDGDLGGAQWPTEGDGPNLHLLIFLLFSR